MNSARNHYVLAEKLWNDQKYGSAVAEFEKAMAKDPKGKLGLQATYRAAMTQFLFLSQYSEAIRNFKSFIQRSTDTAAVWEAKTHIGEIYYSKLEQYDQAILHYHSLLKQAPNAIESPEFIFRIAKSYFFLFQFNDAIRWYQKLIKLYPHSYWAEKSNFEIGLTHFTRAEQKTGGIGVDEMETYELAMSAFENFMKKYPKSQHYAEAKFGMGSCLEEMDRLEEAYTVFNDLRPSYPAPSVIQVKLSRLKERMNQRGRPRQ